MGKEVGTLRFMSGDWGIAVSVTFLSRVGTEMHSSRVALQPRIHPETGVAGGEMGLRDEVRILPGNIQKPGHPPSLP